MGNGEVEHKFQLNFKGKHPIFPRINHSSIEPKKKNKTVVIPLRLQNETGHFGKLKWKLCGI